MFRRLRGFLRVLLPAAAVFLPACLCVAEVPSQLVEGFEKFTASSKDVSGKFEIVESGPGITEGRQALKLEKSSSVTVPFNTDNIERFAWLKIDVYLPDNSAPTRVRIGLTGKTFGWYLTGLCTAGQDTLAVPLSQPIAGTGEWPEEKLTLALLNLGSSALTIDNVRLEGVEPAPPGVILVDVGPEHGTVWPGFSASSPAIAWGKKSDTYGYQTASLDPLTGGFLGHYLQELAKDKLTIESKGVGAAYLWMTHYGRDFIQPPEHYLKMGAKTLASGHLTAAQLLGADGIREGIDSEWTPQWMEKVHVPKRVDFIQVPLQAGENQLDVCNMQVSAAAIVPASSKLAMGPYLEKLKKDLARYRRQFVLGQKMEYRCQLEPTDDESKLGAMVFDPPRGPRPIRPTCPRKTPASSPPRPPPTTAERRSSTSRSCCSKNRPQRFGRGAGPPTADRWAPSPSSA